MILECLLRRILICFSLKVHKGLFCCVKSVSSRNATSQYFHFRFILCYPSSCLVYNMSKNGEKCRSVPPGAWDDVLKCLVLSTTKRYAVYCQRGVKQKWNENYDDDVYQNSCQIIELLKSNRLNDELVQGGVPLGLYVAWEASPKANYSLHYSCTSERTVRISTLLFIRMVSVREQHVARFFYWANEPEKIEARGTRIRHAAPSQAEIAPFIDWPREDQKQKKLICWVTWVAHICCQCSG